MLSDDCETTLRLNASSVVYGGEIVQRISKASKDIEALIDDVRFHSAQAQNAI